MSFDSTLSLSQKFASRYSLCAIQYILTHRTTYYQHLTAYLYWNSTHSTSEYYIRERNPWKAAPFNDMSINDPAAAAYAAQAAADAAEVQVDLSKLNALSPEVISKQATVSCISVALEANLH